MRTERVRGPKDQARKTRTSVEYAIQMGPMLVLAALMTGLVSESVWRFGSFGVITDMLVALAGALLVGATVWLFISSQFGMVAMVAVGCLGGALAIVTQRTLWRSSQSPR